MMLVLGPVQAMPGEASPGVGSPILPEPLTEAHFAALKGSSPFGRSIGLSQSLVLTGVAQIENDVFATLFDLETRESYTVSKDANPLGWQLVGVKGDRADLETLTAQISVAGSGVVSIRYEKIPRSRGPGAGGGAGPSGGGDPGNLTPEQLDEAKKAAVNYREGYSSDGYPRQPPPEIVQKLSKLSVQQREDLNRQMIDLRNRGMGMEDRRKFYEKMVDRSLQGGR